jgi:hypothetical protein
MRGKINTNFIRYKFKNAKDSMIITNILRHLKIIMD